MLGGMIKREDYMTIQVMKDQGMYQKDIAQALDMHPKTVSRALARGGPPDGVRPKRGSKLDPYCAHVDELLAAGVWNASVIFRELQADGYAGEITVLRDYIRPKRALRPGRATVRFETAPGQQMQTDWGSVQTILGDQPTEVHFIVNTLGYSRRFHFWGTDSEDAEHTYEGLIRSFEYFGGVTEEVLLDNQKAAVLQHGAGQRVTYQPRFADLAGCYGFTPRACRPYRARTKGKDERMVGYVKGNFFQRYREFETWAHLNQLAERWLREEADPRVHGTVHEGVAERFTREAPHLKALPTVRFDTAYLETRGVSWDAYIDVRGNRYSVPAALVGQSVRVRIGLDDTLRVYDQEALAAEHRLQDRSLGWVTVEDHHANLWRQTLGSAAAVEQRPLAVYAAHAETRSREGVAWT
jgi:transposase